MAQSAEYFVDYHIANKSQYIYPHYYKPFLEFVNKLREIPKIDCSNKTRTPAGFSELLQLAQTYKNDVYKFADYNLEFIPTSIPDRNQVLADLKSLAQEAIGDIYIPDAMDFVLIKSNIKMYNPYADITFDFGDFKIRMYHNKVIVEGVGNNTKRDGYIHPYVKGGNLCLGEYKKSYQLFYSNMMFYDAWKEVQRCLTSYGGDGLNGTKAGPEHAMNAWIGYQCNVCHSNNIQPEDIVSCVKSKSFICRDCVNTGTCTDEIDGNYYLPNFITKCNSCGKNTSTVINNRCLSCRMG